MSCVCEKGEKSFWFRDFFFSYFKGMQKSKLGM